MTTIEALRNPSSPTDIMPHVQLEAYGDMRKIPVVEGTGLPEGLDFWNRRAFSLDRSVISSHTQTRIERDVWGEVAVPAMFFGQFPIASVRLPAEARQNADNPPVHVFDKHESIRVTLVGPHPNLTLHDFLVMTIATGIYHNAAGLEVPDIRPAFEEWDAFTHEIGDDPRAKRLWVPEGIGDKVMLDLADPQPKTTF